jgi:N-acetyl-anhydromuramyl-L-alanine amidase AmpD
MNYLPHSLGLQIRQPHNTRAVIIHTTGRGLTNVGLQAAPFGTLAFDEACRRWYTNSGTEFYAHTLIGSTGIVYELAAKERICLHTASLNTKYQDPSWANFAIDPDTKKLVEHKRDPLTVYDWWYARWGTAYNPMNFVGSLHVNARSYAVDLIPSQTGTYTDEQYHTLNKLLGVIRQDYPTIQHVIGHADVDPMRRGIVRNSSGVLIGRDWDPGAAFQWIRVVR